MLERKDIESLIDTFAETIRERWKKLLDMYEKNNDVKKTVIATEFDANANELFSQCDRSRLLSIPIAHSPLFFAIKEFILKSEHKIDNDMNCVKSDVRNEVVPFYWLKSEAMKMIVFVNTLSYQYGVKYCRKLTMNNLLELKFPENDTEGQCELMANYALRMIQWMQTMYDNPASTDGIGEMLQKNPMQINFTISTRDGDQRISYTSILMKIKTIKTGK